MFQFVGVIMEARHALEAKGDPRYSILVERLCERLGLSTEEVEKNIMLLASGQRV